MTVPNATITDHDLARETIKLVKVGHYFLFADSRALAKSKRSKRMERLLVQGQEAAHRVLP